MNERARQEQSIERTIEGEKGFNKLLISPQGARIEELFLEGQKIFTKVKRGDKKIGSSHPCIPQFMKETITFFDLPQHGSARDKDFKLETATKTDLMLSQNIEDGKYPKGLRIDQRHSLADGKYSLATIIYNGNDQDLPVNFAEHLYWQTPRGWGGLIINGVDVTEVVKKDSAINLLSENEIIIPGLRPIILEQKGLPIAELWSYKNPETGEYDKNYVCIEPAEGNPKNDFFGSEESMIKSHRHRTTEISIKLSEK